ncbi:MAG: hypothetical protein IH996_07135 [Proteobacteria bacterium]|nr:hypothetical protein [Pseudomonadota bacterium]
MTHSTCMEQSPEQLVRHHNGETAAVTSATKVNPASTGRSSIKTVQAPHSPQPQPFLVPLGPF